MARIIQSAAVVLCAVLAVFIYTAEPQRWGAVFGITRKPVASALREVRKIPHTKHCEDVHLHAASNLLFTACEGHDSQRFAWFPPLANFGDPTAALKVQGSIKVIDPSTMTVTKLKFTDFNGPFITHGIDVIDDPEAQDAVYIFAVNHVPSGDYMANRDTKAAKARSLVEVFRHVIGTDELSHIRSVWDPLITTPNDIFAISPTSFFVTNDHYFRESHMRIVEDIYWGAKWSNTIHVEFAEYADGAMRDDTHGVKASVALGGMHNNNGIAHGRTANEVLVASCASGRIHIGNITGSPPRIQLLQSIEYDSIVDNPHYFRDPYADAHHDASGILGPGLSNAGNLSKSHMDPHGHDGVMVWKASQKGDRWVNSLLFQDDATHIRTASGAALVAIDPAKEGGKRRGWLFVTGFMSENMVAAKIDL